MDAALRISDGAVHSRECNSRQQPTAGTYTYQHLTLYRCCIVYGAAYQLCRIQGQRKFLIYTVFMHALMVVWP